MAETNDLLHAVLAAPDDDAPRLVYADALMDQNASRGELIALQIRLVREQLAPDERLTLASATRELVREHEARFLSRYRSLDAGCVFRRGFIEQLTAPASALLGSDDFGRLMAEEPVRELVLLAVRDATIEELARSPLFRRLTALICRGELSTVGAGALAASPQLAQLSLLDLAGTRIGAGGCAALAGAERLAPAVLALNGTDAGDDGAIALSRGPALRRCRRLLLARNHIRDRGGTALANSTVLNRLQHLALGGNDGLDPTTRHALRARWGAHVEL